MPVYSADLIYTLTHPEPLSGYGIETDDTGKIISIEPLEHYQDNHFEIQYVNGIIVPGFTHCHLELSHMKGLIPTGTGLIEFIKNIVTRRGETPIEAILSEIAKGEDEMIREGIVAVGDISNQTDTFYQKSMGRLYYHTFVEAFDLLQNGRMEIEIQKSQAVLDQLTVGPGHKKSLVPHAPYSVSRSMFKSLNDKNNKSTSVSIHHQETLAENQFMFNKTGALMEFYQSLNLNLNDFNPIGAMSSRQIIDLMDPGRRTLLVHNTMSTPYDINAIQAWNPNTYWVTCPNANLYIENRMPFYKYFMDQEVAVCIGTDSLASNWGLSVLEEMKTIQRLQSYVPWELLVRWATLNGARALGFEQELGSLEIGKSPGLVNIFPFDQVKQQLVSDSQATRLI
jgi:cytosine/adenosine deaminase-related metal-dependent hydrolase